MKGTIRSSNSGPGDKEDGDGDKEAEESDDDEIEKKPERMAYPSRGITMKF